MHFKGLDLNLLVVLDALLTERSTTRAGERLYLSQSATSGALARLREFFGDPLLIRGPQNKMVLTPLAEGLAQPVRQILMQAEDVVTYNAAFDPATSTRRFRLNMGDEVATVLMTKVLERIRQEAPNLCIEIVSYQGRSELAQDLAELLERGELDFLIAPKQLASPHHPMEPLFTDTFVCVAWLGNRLIGEKISKEQYFSLGHIVTRFGPQQSSTEDETLSEEAAEKKVEIVAPSFGLKANFLIGTNLIATMQETLAQFYARYLPLKILPLPVPHQPISMQIQWHRYQDHDPGVRWLLKALRECADSVYTGNRKTQARR
jgi:LysR family transcriptional regulator, nod-box dependent transcriptional activator